MNISKGILDPKIIPFLIYFVTELQYLMYKIMLSAFKYLIWE